MIDLETQTTGETDGGDLAVHRPFLWGLCYRMTGSAADADDLVQETFTRALARPPADTGRPWRPWLTRVAVNLSRDLLRSRRRRAYVGPWLPSPIETGDDASPPLYEPLRPDPGAEGRYDRLESVTFAFLLALEVLTPQQRAVLLLRDVFDYSALETAETLGISDTNVRTSLLRARRSMSAYDQTRCRPTLELQRRTREVLEAFVAALVRQDPQAIEAVLSDDVRTVTDGGGVYIAARRPVVGREEVARFHRKLVKGGIDGIRFDVRMINGLPAVVLEDTRLRPGYPPRQVFRADLDAAGRLYALHTVVAPRKLTAVGFGGIPTQ